MMLQWSSAAWADMLYWAKHDKKLLARIVLLIDAIDQDPFSGIGKPECLKQNLSGFWSRRINDEHRLVYQVKDEVIIIIQARFHY